MKQLATFLLLITSLTAFGQSSIELPFNPDADGNGFISVSDILEVLSTYDTIFTAEEVLVNGTELNSFISETNSTIDSLSAAAVVCENLQYLESYEAYLENSSSCWLTYNGIYDFMGFEIPNSCRFVTVFGNESQSVTQTLTPIRLPENGLFPGQIIDFRLTDVYLWDGQLEIQALQEGNWQTIGSLFQDLYNSPATTYLYSSQQNERFVWNGVAWSNMEPIIQQIGWSSID